MNITLSAEKTLIEKARAYAKKHNTTLNNLVRNYLSRIVDGSEVKQVASEFADIALTHAGKSDKQYIFNRENIYNR